MDDKDMHTFQKAFDLDGITATKHQRMLKNQLIAELKREQSVSQGRVNFLGLVYSFIQYIMKKPKLTLGTLGIVGVFFFGLFSLTPTTLAQKTLNSAITQIESLSSVQIQNITKLLGANPVESLKEAKKAHDLRKVSEKEFLKETATQKEAVGTIEGIIPSIPVETPGTSGVVTVSSSMSDPIMAGSGNSINVGMLPVTGEKSSSIEISGAVIVSNITTASGIISPLTITGYSIDSSKLIPIQMNDPVKIKVYLRYTNTDGHVTFLGLNPKNIPVMKHVVIK